MIEIENTISKLEKLLAELPEKAVEIALVYEPEILDMQAEQHDEGVTNRGRQIQPDYSPFTVRIKEERGQPSDRVTLYDRGDFRAGFFVAKGKSAFSIGSSDDKAESIERKYGNEIFGLTDENLQELIELIRPEIHEFAENTIFN